MRQFVRMFRRSKRHDMVGDQSGVAAVEFALIGMGMFTMLSGAVDVTNAITIQRDLNRVAVEIALVLAACPTEGRVDETIQAIMEKRANIAPQLPTMQLGMVRFREKNNQIDGNSVGGTMTFLPGDMSTRALALLKEGDSGVAVLVTYTHQPIILGLADDWGFRTKNFRATVETIRLRAP